MYSTKLYCSLFIRLNHYLTLRLPSSPPFVIPIHFLHSTIPYAVSIAPNSISRAPCSTQHPARPFVLPF
ncbi:uncharacterized protein IAS62_000895 [Cryptococcus decagattii]|uniref:Uncharacterized protein n=1 Tax=Cryptococcus decagattii TaxID=1859122 RepID=A0ABZ2AQY1_9TREE